MKNIKNFEGLFNKDGDDFANKLLDIIEKEKININFNNKIDAKYSVFNGSYNVNVDGVDYYFSYDYTIGTIIPDYFIVVNGDKLSISYKVFKRLKNIYKSQNIQLPDLSDIGRSSKKYNL